MDREEGRRGGGEEEGFKEQPCAVLMALVESVATRCE